LVVGGTTAASYGISQFFPADGFEDPNDAMGALIRSLTVSDANHVFQALGEFFFHYANW
jgi:hypothetical protein